MSDQINQIQATYDALEDRILLKFKTLNEEVYLAWVSRRFCKLLLPVLQGRHPQNGQQLLEPTEDLEREFAQEKAQLAGDYSSPYQAPEKPKFPLGETPILLAQISFTHLNSKQATFRLEPNHGQGLALPFHPQLLGPLLKILTQAIEKTDWDLGNEMLYQMPAADSALH